MRMTFYVVALLCLNGPNSNLGRFLEKFFDFLVLSQLLDVAVFSTDMPMDKCNSNSERKLSIACSKLLSAVTESQ